MELKFTVLSKLSSRSELCDSFEDFLDVLSHLPVDDYFTVAIVSSHNLYTFDYFSNQKNCNVFQLIHFVKEIRNGER